MADTSRTLPILSILFTLETCSRLFTQPACVKCSVRKQKPTGVTAWGVLSVDTLHICSGAAVPVFPKGLDWVTIMLFSQEQATKHNMRWVSSIDLANLLLVMQSRQAATHRKVCS